MTSGTYEMYVNYLYSPKFDGDNIEDGWESRWENAKEILHKLNKQQRERWRHLGNISQLFFVRKYSFERKFWWRQCQRKEVENFQENAAKFVY